MAPSADAVEPLALPTAGDWAAVRLRIGSSLHGGHQSHVFRVERDGRQLVAKLTGARLVDASFERRVEVAERLSERLSSAIGPVRIDGSLVTRMGEWLLVVWPYVTGRHPDINDVTDVMTMATALASLHRSLAAIDIDLPRVAALRGRSSADEPWSAADQLLHGDFSAANLFIGEDGPKVFDYDDCGYGPIEFEIGNTMYMALFDATVEDNLTGYLRFREVFVDAYEHAAGRPVGAEMLDAAIDLRKAALGRWLDGSEHAPIGIRTATPAWRDRLRAFVVDDLPRPSRP